MTLWPGRASFIASSAYGFLTRLALRQSRNGNTFDCQIFPHTSQNTIVGSWGKSVNEVLVEGNVDSTVLVTSVISNQFVSGLQ